MIVPYLSCHCGAREDDKGGPSPRTCWNCGKETMVRPEKLYNTEGE